MAVLTAVAMLGDWSYNYTETYAATATATYNDLFRVDYGWDTDNTFTYNGSVQIPSGYSVYYIGNDTETPLTQAVYTNSGWIYNYRVYYSTTKNDTTSTASCVDAGTYYMVFVGINGYNFTISVPFTIAPKSIGEYRVSTTSTSMYYDEGNSVTPSYIFSDTNQNNYGLIEDKDFTVKYTNVDGTAITKDGDVISKPCDVGEYKADIKGKGNYTGLNSTTFYVAYNLADESHIKVELTTSKYTYNNKAHMPGGYVWYDDDEDGEYNGTDRCLFYWDGEENANIYVSCYRESDPAITAVMDKDTFRSYVAASGTITLSYTTTWSADPALYGITVSNEPIDGDQIVIYYVKEDRGTITVSNPTSFVSTGWNLYNNTNGYARVLKYSDTYGFKIGGTYTGVKFSSTLTGTQTPITPDANGLFTISEDGYVWVTGGNATDTYVIMTWSDWINGYDGTWKAYSEDTISLSTVMTNFPNGLFWVNGVADEINLNMQTATSNIERLAYNAANLATAKASGRDYECDNNYIYLVREEPIVYDISVDGEHTAYDHGMEIVNGTTVPVYVETMYGYNLKDMIRHDLPEQITSLSSQIASLVQESAFSIVVENGEHVLYWYGAAGECPYTVALENGVYVLYYNYTTV